MIEKSFSYGLFQALQKGEVKVGSKIKIPGSTSCWRGGSDFYKIQELSYRDDGSLHFVQNCNGKCCCNDLHLPFILQLEDAATNSPATNQSFMSSLISKAKKLALKVSNPDEAVLRESGIKDECGNLTEEGKALLLDILVEETAINAKLVSLAKALVDEAKQ